MYWGGLDGECVRLANLQMTFMRKREVKKEVADEETALISLLEWKSLLKMPLFNLCRPLSAMSHAEKFD